MSSLRKARDCRTSRTTFLYKYTGLTFAFNWKGAAIATAVMAFPLLVRSVRLSIENIDQGLEFAARTLGAGQMRVFFTITLPLMIPGIITGLILAFARSLEEFGATITFVSNIPGQTWPRKNAALDIFFRRGGFFPICR